VAQSVQESPTSAAGSGCLPKARIWRALVALVATGAFVGYSPVVPGTVGSLLGLLLVKFAFGSLWMHWPAGFLMLFGVVFIVACGVTDYAEKIFGEPDSSAIVLDEILGMVATMFGNPIAWPWLIAGFTLFRLFDIIKPWPASRLDRIPGGIGVMLDDLGAAFYANVTLQVLRRLV
jgi:phosphatidylglycerophosphatase A